MRTDDLYWSWLWGKFFFNSIAENFVTSLSKDFGIFWFLFWSGLYCRKSIGMLASLKMSRNNAIINDWKNTTTFYFHRYSFKLIYCTFGKNFIVKYKSKSHYQIKKGVGKFTQHEPNFTILEGGVLMSKSLFGHIEMVRNFLNQMYRGNYTV